MITFQLRRLAFCALTALLTGSSLADHDDPKRVVATVNGLEITEFRIKDAQSVSDRKEKLEKVIDESLILQAAQKQKISVPEQFIKERIEAIVRDSFNGDRFKFENALQAEGYLVKDFEKVQEEQILLQVMRRQITKDWADKESKEKALADWLAAARQSAEISYK